MTNRNGKRTNHRNQNDPIKIAIGASPITLAQLDDLLGRPLKIDIPDDAWNRVERSSEIVERLAQSSKPAYGINTGFGLLCKERIPPDQVRELQVNLVVSHAVGTGALAPPEVVRWMMLFKMHALSHGLSGISRDTLQCLGSLLDADILPDIPTKGSLGASGDLAPLAHMVLPMIGLGRVRLRGESLSAKEALKRCGVTPAALGPKEGLALINGTQFMCAYAAVILTRAKRIAKHADIVAALSLDALKGSDKPFDNRLHLARPHPGAIETAENVRSLLVGSDILATHANCERVQDPYSLRCIPQVHGASRDAMRHAEDVVEREVNSVTDNPLVFDNDEVVSGGLFHGQPLAIVLDYLAIALSEFASISERRTYLLLSGVEELPVFLLKDTGLNSGFMMTQYTAAALVSENKGLCTPASVDSIPSSNGQEDHVSMGARAAVKCLQILDNVETVLAIEMLCAAQAMDLRAPLKSSTGLQAAHRTIRQDIDVATIDREFGKDIAKSLELLRSQRMLRAVEGVLGSLH